MLVAAVTSQCNYPRATYGGLKRWRKTLKVPFYMGHKSQGNTPIPLACVNTTETRRRHDQEQTPCWLRAGPPNAKRAEGELVPCLGDAFLVRDMGYNSRAGHSAGPGCSSELHSADNAALGRARCWFPTRWHHQRSPACGASRSEGSLGCTLPISGEHHAALATPSLFSNPAACDR